MQVSDAIAIARKISNAHARIARVLSRLKPVLQMTGTIVRPSWSDPVEVVFHCQTVEDADKLAAQLPVKLELKYTGNSSLLTFETEIGDVQWEFRIPTIRPITIDHCNMVRKKRRNWGDCYDAYLFFNEFELVKFAYQKAKFAHHKVVKEHLWKMAIEQQATNSRLARFQFVL